MKIAALLAGAVLAACAATSAAASVFIDFSEFGPSGVVDYGPIGQFYNGVGGPDLNVVFRSGWATAVTQIAPDSPGYRFALADPQGDNEIDATAGPNEAFTGVSFTYFATSRVLLHVRCRCTDGIAEDLAFGDGNFHTFSVVFSNPSAILQIRPEYGRFGITDLTLTTAAVDGVPEPATWALMLGGFGLAGGVLRRRRAIASPALP